MSRIYHDITGRRRGFTLTELLVAIAIIAVLASITVVAIRGISKDAKLASGKNTVMAVLDFARARAIKDQRIVIVAFRPRLLDEGKQVIEAVFAQWTGESYINDGNCGIGGFVPLVDRFEPIPDAPPRRLPEGINVAGPLFGDDSDDTWVTQAHLPKIDQQTFTGEVSGAVVAVMFDADGSTISRNSRSDSHFSWIDWNDNGEVEASGTSVPPNDETVACFFDQRWEDDETLVTIAPYLAVYDDVEAREFSGGNWSNGGAGLANYQNELIGPEGYITNYADRIHFNRFSGVAMK